VVFSAFAAENVSSYNWAEADSLLEESIKKQPTGFRSSPVETERKFIEIVVQVFWADGSLMRSKQPSLQQ
jgi:hypothetical protein